MESPFFILSPPMIQKLGLNLKILLKNFPSDLGIFGIIEPDLDLIFRYLRSNKTQNLDDLKVKTELGHISSEANSFNNNHCKIWTETLSHLYGIERTHLLGYLVYSQKQYPCEIDKQKFLRNATEDFFRIRKLILNIFYTLLKLLISDRKNDNLHQTDNILRWFRDSKLADLCLLNLNKLLQIANFGRFGKYVIAEIALFQKILFLLSQLIYIDTSQLSTLIDVVRIFPAIRFNAEKLQTHLLINLALTTTTFSQNNNLVKINSQNGPQLQRAKASQLDFSPLKDQLSVLAESIEYEEDLTQLALVWASSKVDQTDEKTMSLFAQKFFVVLLGEIEFCASGAPFDAEFGLLVCEAFGHFLSEIFQNYFPTIERMLKDYKRLSPQPLRAFVKLLVFLLDRNVTSLRTLKDCRNFASFLASLDSAIHPKAANEVLLCDYISLVCALLRYTETNGFSLKSITEQIRANKEVTKNWISNYHRIIFRKCQQTQNSFAQALFEDPLESIPSDSPGAEHFSKRTFVCYLSLLGGLLRALPREKILRGRDEEVADFAYNAFFFTEAVDFEAKGAILSLCNSLVAADDALVDRSNFQLFTRKLLEFITRLNSPENVPEMANLFPPLSTFIEQLETRRKPDFPQKTIFEETLKKLPGLVYAQINALKKTPKSIAKPLRNCATLLKTLLQIERKRFSFEPKKSAPESLEVYLKICSFAQNSVTAPKNTFLELLAARSVLTQCLCLLDCLLEEKSTFEQEIALQFQRKRPKIAEDSAATFLLGNPSLSKTIFCDFLEDDITDFGGVGIFEKQLDIFFKLALSDCDFAKRILTERKAPSLSKVSLLGKSLGAVRTAESFLEFVLGRLQSGETSAPSLAVFLLGLDPSADPGSSRSSLDILFHVVMEDRSISVGTTTKCLQILEEILKRPFSAKVTAAVLQRLMPFDFEGLINRGMAKVADGDFAGNLAHIEAAASLLNQFLRRLVERGSVVPRRIKKIGLLESEESFTVVEFFKYITMIPSEDAKTNFKLNSLATVICEQIQLQVLVLSKEEIRECSGVFLDLIYFVLELIIDPTTKQSQKIHSNLATLAKTLLSALFSSGFKLSPQSPTANNIDWGNFTQILIQAQLKTRGLTSSLALLESIALFLENAPAQIQTECFKGFWDLCSDKLNSIYSTEEIFRESSTLEGCLSLLTKLFAFRRIESKKTLKLNAFLLRLVDAVFGCKSGRLDPKTTEMSANLISFLLLQNKELAHLFEYRPLSLAKNVVRTPNSPNSFAPLLLVARASQVAFGSDSDLREILITFLEKNHRQICALLNKFASESKDTSLSKHIFHITSLFVWLYSTVHFALASESREQSAFEKTLLAVFIRSSFLVSVCVALPHSSLVFEYLAASVFPQSSQLESCRKGIFDKVFERIRIERVTTLQAICVNIVSIITPSTLNSKVSFTSLGPSSADSKDSSQFVQKYFRLLEGLEIALKIESVFAVKALSEPQNAINDLEPSAKRLVSVVRLFRFYLDIDSFLFELKCDEGVSGAVKEAKTRFGSLFRAFGGFVGKMEKRFVDFGEVGVSLREMENCDEFEH